MPTFSTLWDKFPHDDSLAKKCFNKQTGKADNAFENYCAIKLSECLIQSTVAFEVPGRARCWSHKKPHHFLRAEDMAAWLGKRQKPFIGKTEDIPPGSFQKVLDGRTGIIFFKDYWQRKKETFANRSGDHIDLWNGSRLTGGSMWMRSISEFFGWVSDLNDSKQIKFWEIK